MIFITSIGDLLNLFEFHCLEYQVFFYSAVTAGLFLSLQPFYYLASTDSFSEAFLLFFALSLFVSEVFMHHWDRDISGKLQRVCTPTEQGCEVSVQSEQMDPLPEEQQSQQEAPMNPTSYRLMRDHIHPPRVSAPPASYHLLRM